MQTGIGDSCRPDSIPEGGFLATETYLETSSVQCQTRVCIVDGFEGDRTLSSEECAEAGSPEDCSMYPTNAELDEQLYCTGRCAAPDGVSGPLCECDEGFTCEETITQGGDGIVGSYCIRAP